jgi:hypothetical protein
MTLFLFPPLCTLIFPQWLISLHLTVNTLFESAIIINSIRSKNPALSPTPNRTFPSRLYYFITLNIKIEHMQPNDSFSHDKPTYYRQSVQNTAAKSP